MAIELFKRPGSPYYYAYLKDPRQSDGVLRRSTKRSVKREAAEVAGALQKELDKALANYREPSGLTWIDAATLYLLEGGLKASTAYNYKSIIGIVANSCLGDFDLGTLTHEQLRRFIKERRETVVCPHNAKTKAKAQPEGRSVSDATIRRHLSFISAVYKHCIDNEVPGAPEENPLDTFSRRGLKESPQVDRHLRPVQFEDVLNSCVSAEHKRMLIVLVGAGIRSGELTQLKWSEIDPKFRYIEFGNLDRDRTKVGRSRRVPISDIVKEALTAQKAAQKRDRIENPEGLVFPSPKTGGERYSLSYLRKAVQRRTGLKTYTNHGLRHTFASWTLQGGLDPIALRDILGHTTLSTSTRYARHVPDSVADRFRSVHLPIHRTEHRSDNPAEAPEGDEA